MPLELKTDDAITPIRDSELIVDGAKDVVYYVRHITKEKHRQAVRKRTDKLPNRRTRAMEDVIDWEGVSDDLLDYALTKWEGVFSNGEPLDCTTENKRLLDGTRSTALLDRAGMNDITGAGEDREASFRTAEKPR